MLFDLPKDEPSIIKVVGVGGGGSNAVNHMYRQGIVGVDFAVCNTDRQALENSPVPVRIQLGLAETGGLGAGSKPEKGKKACIESIEEIKRWLENGTRMVFITAGMGGGTGTGAAPIIAKAAREMGILTVGIVTLPFTFEGRTRVTQGFEGLDELKRSVDTLIVISNDKLRQMHGNLSISQAFAQADNILTTAAKGIAEIITVPGYVNVDFEDVNTVMRESGVAIMGTGLAEGDGRAKKAADEALNSPLLEDSNIHGAKHILVNITSGGREATMDEIFEITEFVQNEAGSATNLIWGNCFDERLGEKLAVTVIATGFEAAEKRPPVSRPASQPSAQPTKRPESQKPAETRIALDDETPKKALALSGISEIADLSKDGMASDGAEIEFDVQETVAKLNRTAKSLGAEPFVKPDPDEARRRQLEESARRRASARDRQPSVPKLSSPQTVIEMESQPAYLRRNVLLDDVSAAGDLGMSRWTVSVDDEPAIKMTGNAFLHDQVD